MRLTKFGHACVALEADGVRIVVDPGVFTQPDAVDNATAIVITHEHADHYHPDHLARSDAPIFTIEAVATKLRADAPAIAERVTVVSPGAQLDVGVPVEVIGANHAVIHPEFERFDNSGFLFTFGDQRVFHPGDALTVPSAQIDVLCAPISAPWLKVSEAVDFARAVNAPVNVAIHDRIYTDLAQQMAVGHLRRVLEPRGQSYRLLADEESL